MAAVMEDQVFRAFASYAAVVLLKVLVMSPLTTVYRFSRGAFANEEDVALKPPDQRKKMLRADPDVERVRRCHQNDLENAVPFVLVGLLYALTGPELSCALFHFRLFTGARLFHTVSYVMALPQPCRALSFLVGLGVNFSMTYCVLRSVFVL